MICEHAATAVCNAILAAPLIEILTHAKFSKTRVTRVTQLEIGSTGLPLREAGADTHPEKLIQTVSVRSLVCMLCTSGIDQCAAYYAPLTSVVSHNEPRGAKRVQFLAADRDIVTHVQEEGGVEKNHV